MNDELVLTDDTGAELRRATLGWGAAYVPASEAAPGLTGSDWLIAGRSVSTSTGVGMRVERRSLEGLSVVSEHPLSSYEAAVDRPEPRALEVGPGVAVLALVSQRRTSDDSASLCVYLTPLDEDGASSGPAVRVDEGPVSVDGPAVDNVLVLAREGAFFVLWQRAPDMWLARVDHAE